MRHIILAIAMLALAGPLWAAGDTFGYLVSTCEEAVPLIKYIQETGSSGGYPGPDEDWISLAVCANTLNGMVGLVVLFSEVMDSGPCYEVTVEGEVYTGRFPSPDEPVGSFILAMLAVTNKQPALRRAPLAMGFLTAMLKAYPECKVVKG
jgi:hypothetical protein